MQNELPELFIIAPIYNEAQIIPDFVKRVIQSTKNISKYRPHLILVDDGSEDESKQIIIKLKNDFLNTSISFSLSAIFLSKNFGHQSAICAGMDYTKNRANKDSLFVILDSDLEHPPELIPSMISHLTNTNIDHLQMVRQSNEAISLFKKYSSVFFYKFFEVFTKLKIPNGSADFRCFNYEVANALFQITEVDRLNRGLFWWVGFKIDTMEYQAPLRQKGESKYTLAKMCNLALSGVTSFSSFPLIATQIFLVAISFFIFSIYVLYELKLYFFDHVKFVVGWSSLIATIFFWGGVNALGQLIQSFYLSKILIETKKRPLYIIQKTLD